MASAQTSPIIARGLIELAEAFEIDESIYAGLRDALHAEGEPWLPASLEDRFWCGAADASAARDFGAVAASESPVGAFGGVELAAMSAPDVRHALRTLSAASDVLHGDPVFDLAEREDGSGALVYRSPHDRGTDGGAMAAELALTSAVELIRRGTGEDAIAPSAAHLRGQPHARPRSLAHALGCSVETGAVLDRLELPRGVLDLSLVSHDPRMHRLALRLLTLERESLARRWPGTASRGLARDVVLARDAALAQLARSIGLSERALRMRLSRESTRVRGLLDDARRAAADRMLLAGRRPVDVQRALGYADLASLRRAFQRWWGHGPTARRASLTTDTIATNGDTQMSPRRRTRPR